MEYRRLGRSGLKVSVLSFGSWVSFGTQMGLDTALACMDTAQRAGVNFWDNAEAYAGGQSEQIMGDAIKELGWKRHEYVISTKLFWGIHGGVNMSNTLNRKYLMQAIDGSLERLGLDFVDLVFCHRADPDTPIEETVWAMSDMISQGRALYWGTSMWTADEIRAAYEIAERHHLHKPVMEQPQYHLLDRVKVEIEYARLYDDIGLGLTTWSPLASGLLTGKYLDGIPEDSRGALPGYEWLQGMLTNEKASTKVRALKEIADELGCTLAQLAIAWCAKNPRVSTVITGASRPAQVEDNMGALEVLGRLDDEVLARIDAATGWGTGG
ncbi:MAG: potassium channel beta subunit family protein [Actinomycetes bacterium]